MNNLDVSKAMIIKLDDELPDMPEFVDGIRRASARDFRLSKEQTKIALKNALRYVPEQHHKILAPEFLHELMTRGRIYGYRFRPQGRIYGKSIDEYKGKCLAGKALQVMIDNNLDFDVALYPYELVTYGETGSVCQNWMQYRLIKKYLENLTEDQTLVMESGHPVGLFPSKPDAPRVIVTNALMVGITVERVSKKRMHEEWVNVGGDSESTPQGLTITPKSTAYNPIMGNGKIEVFILERMSRELARETIFHELMHVAQFLCGVEVEEKLPMEWAKFLTTWFKERKKE